MWGGHAPLGSVQWRPSEVRPLPCHRSGGGAFLRLQGAGLEQGWSQPSIPCLWGCGRHGSLRQSPPPRWEPHLSPAAHCNKANNCTFLMCFSPPPNSWSFSSLDWDDQIHRGGACWYDSFRLCNLSATNNDMAFYTDWVLNFNISSVLSKICL